MMKLLLVSHTGSVHDVANEIVEKGGDAFPIRCDVRFENDISNTVSRCMQQFGRIDVAVYNAGLENILFNVDTIKLKYTRLFENVNVEK